jgi:lipoprotein-releasing system ATP-binding protein
MIECQDVFKEIGFPPQRILQGLSFLIHDGEFVAISGRSGSGKSTLLYLLSTLDFPTSGSLKIDTKETKEMSPEEIHQFRNLNVGFIFQYHYLLTELSAIENVILPARNLNIHEKVKPYAFELLKRLGIFPLAKKYPNQLSGGEQQRVAIARALLLRPRYLFADEPTGNLDTFNAKIVMDLLRETNQVEKTTVCLVTHDPQFASQAMREIYLVDGKISPRE